MSEDESPTARVLRDVEDERRRQVVKWGVQHHPDLDGKDDPHFFAVVERFYKDRVDSNVRAGTEVPWSWILLEEVHEALAEADPARLRAELVQAAAVCAAWIEDMDSRTHECDWRRNGSCEGYVTQGDPFVVERIYELEEGEEEMWLCDGHRSQRADEV